MTWLLKEFFVFHHYFFLFFCISSLFFSYVAKIMKIDFSVVEIFGYYFFVFFNFSNKNSKTECLKILCNS